MQRRDLKNLLYLGGSIVGIVILSILIGVAMKPKVSSQDLANANINGMRNESNMGSTAEASIGIGRTITEMQNEVQSENEIENEVAAEVASTEKENVANATGNTAGNAVVAEEPKQEVKEELSFMKPVEGEMIRGFAKETLVYSETLKEWITHLGIDIKANKTTTVKAVEKGTVFSIKNDPRYGLTVVLEHVDGYKTVYSNLLTAEFVTEGEKLEKGQVLGTVGNTATFEYLDEPHLHFEMLKDNIPLDPQEYLK